jgi:hypothetical protein
VTSRYTTSCHTRCSMSLVTCSAASHMLAFKLFRSRICPYKDNSLHSPKEKIKRCQIRIYRRSQTRRPHTLKDSRDTNTGVGKCNGATSWHLVAANETQNYWVFGLCITSGILKNYRTHCSLNWIYFCHHVVGRHILSWVP